MNTPQQNYMLTGIVLNVGNTTTGVSGNVTSIFSKVVVTNSEGATFTLLPTAALGYLVLPGSTGQPGTSNAVALEGVFTSPSETDHYGLPSQYKHNYYWQNPPLTDSEISALPDQDGYSYQYFLAGNNSNTPDSTQYYRSEARAQSAAEFESYLSFFPSITVPSPATLTATTLGLAPDGDVAPPANGAMSISWNVPAGGQPVTTVQLFGYLPGTGVFQDEASVAAGATSANVSCTAQSSGDAHCVSTNFSPSDEITTFDFSWTAQDGSLFLQSYNVISLF